MRILFAGMCALVVLTSTSQATAQGNRRGRNARSAPVQPQTQPALPKLPDIRNDPDVQAADIAIIANITAAELRIDAVPNSTVEFLDKAKNQTIWEVQRFNLPDKIEPGVTYRNIGIRLKITSRFADIERIVAEALGEVPISEVDSGDKAAPGDSLQNTIAKPPGSETAPPNAKPKTKP